MLLIALMSFSCSDQDILSDVATQEPQSSNNQEEVLPRLVFSSRDELKDVLSQLNEGVSLTNLNTRAITAEQLPVVSEQKFQSLLEVN